MDQEHIIKRTPHKLSAARNEAGAEAPAGGQKTRGCIEGEEPGFEFRSFLLGAHVGLHACARRRHAHPPRARRQQRYADINASFTEPCIYTHLHLHTRTHTCLQTHTHAHIYTNTHTHIYLSIYPYRSIYISFSLSLSPPSLFLALSLSLYIYIYIYNIYIYIYIPPLGQVALMTRGFISRGGTQNKPGAAASEMGWPLHEFPPPIFYGV